MPMPLAKHRDVIPLFWNTALPSVVRLAGSVIARKEAVFSNADCSITVKDASSAKVSTSIGVSAKAARPMN